MTRRDTLRLLGGALGSSIWQSYSAAQGPLTLTPLTDTLLVLSGAGGNITVLRSPEGLLILDSGLPETAAGVMAKLKDAGGMPVRHLINTHWHNDHTGGNEALGKAGAHIMAHENCAKRLATKQHIEFMNKNFEPVAAVGRPKETFKGLKDLSFGGQSIACQYFSPAHTDTDITIHFKEANVYTTGDLFFNGFYPFIDYSTGGSIEGMISNAAAMTEVLANDTKVVPGHGPVGTKAQLQAYHDMLADTNEQISKLIASGKTTDEVIAAGPTSKFDAQWGGGFLKPAAWVGMICQGKMLKKAA